VSDTEDELVRFIEGCNTIGYSRTKQIMELVQLVMSDKGRNVKVTEGWWSSFRRRHPQLVLRTAEPVSRIRHVGTTPEILNNYFDLLEDFILSQLLYLTWMKQVCRSTLFVQK
jgi:hypothetical protein